MSWRELASTLSSYIKLVFGGRGRMVRVAVGAKVGVREGSGVAVQVEVGVFVGVRVLVDVAVAVGVSVDVEVAVAVGVEVEVGVGLTNATMMASRLSETPSASI